MKQQGSNVLHGAIREVSLVLAGANPGAFIDSVLSHGEESDEEAIIYTGENIYLSHGDEKENQMKDKPENEKTVADVFNTLTEEQKNVVYAMIGMAIEENEAADDDENPKGGNENMKHNVFDRENIPDDVLSHSDMEAIFADVKRYGSLRDSALAHGIEQIDYLFPDKKTITNAPQFVQRDMGWVQKVMSSTHHTPFSRIKSVLADYNVGADKGGAVNMFDDFDIDYNAQKYLIETRCSGALIKPYSAIALEQLTVNP